MTDIRETAKEIGNPFDHYDFFGYIFPGTVLFMNLGIIAYFYTKLELNTYVLSIYNISSDTAGGIVIIISTLVCGLISMYVMGQFLSGFGSFLLGRIFFYDVFGYPAYYLLGLPDQHERDAVGATYRFMFLTLFIYFLIIFISIIIKLFFNYNFYFLVVFTFAFLFFLFVLVSFRVLLIYIHSTDYYSEKYGEHKLFIKFLLKIRHVYILFSDQVVNRLIELVRISMNNKNPFGAEFITKYSKVITSYIGIKDGTDLLDEVKILKNENYWIPYLEVFKKEINTLSKYHKDYRFSRTTATAFLLANISYIVIILTDVSFLLNNRSMLIHFLISIILFWSFFTRYMHIKQTKFDKYILRTFVIQQQRYIDNEND